MKDELIHKLNEGLESALSRFKEDALSLRTSRPSPALVENILVECYGTKMSLKEVATISIEQGNVIVIQPWDKQNLQPIEKAILRSDLGIAPAASGDILRVRMPALTAERREEIARILRRKTEEARIVFRGERDDARKKIVELFSEKEISEDDKFRFQEEVQKNFDDYQKKLQDFAAEREKEIMSVD